jgi:hypothetical protein
VHRFLAWLAWRPKLPDLLVRAFFLVLLGCSLWSAVQLFSLDAERQALRADAVELSKIKYGIFNVDEWKLIAARIIAEKIEEFDLSTGERGEMRKKINTFLYRVISELKERFNEENKRGVLGFIKRGGAGFFGIFDQMERDVPVFTDQILGFLDDPANRKELKALLIAKVNAYADSTFSETDYVLHDAILLKHGISDRHTAIEVLNERSVLIDAEKRPFATAMYVLLAVGFLYLIFVRKPDKWAISFITGISIFALSLGVLLPMIEIDARIDRLSFMLLGEPVTFTGQVLFHKSKSILEVVELMAVQGKADLLAVGLLVLTFSVLFPLSKMIASLLYIHLPGVQNRKSVNFLVFKTGKWSMADVMVVAIFMAYIGFSGILSEQLSQLEGIARNADVLTTNQSSLQTGFFMFTGFVVLSLALAQRLSKFGGNSAQRG